MPESHRVATGFSQNSKASDAILEACEKALEKGGFQRTDWAIIFASMQFASEYRKILQLAREALRTDCLVGCSAAGILTEQGEINHCPVVGVMAACSDQLRIHPFLIPDLKDRNAQLAGEILQRLPENASTVVLFPDIFNLEAESFFRVFNEFNQKREIPLKIVGGAPSSEIPSEGTIQFAGDEITQGGVSGFFLESKSDQVHVGVSQGCRLVTPAFIVTANEGQWILELDGKPAFQVLRENLPGPLVDDLRRLTRHVFLALPPGQKQELDPANFLARNIAGIDPTNHVIACAGKVRKGMPIGFALRNGDSAREHLKGVLKDLKTRVSHPESKPHFGLYFNCCARGESLYGIPDIDTSYISSEFADLPLFGLSSFGEIGPIADRHYLHAYTGVLMLA